MTAAGPAARSAGDINVPGYTIQRRIGHGGMAVVYLATQDSLQRPVALKVLRSAHAESTEFTERFLNEGRTLASLAHRNIIIIHDIGVAGEVRYIAMEYLEGGDLRRRMRDGLALDAVLEHLQAVAGALHFAHCKGVVHRDVKPANVMFRLDGTLVLTDFGIAKQLHGGSDLTVTGSTIGSPHYISPEQAKAQPVDARSDIYSAGIMLYEMLTGKKPYHGNSDIDTVLKHLTEPSPVLVGELARFQPLVDRMLAKDPAERFQSAAELARALAEAREGRFPESPALAARATAPPPPRAAATGANESTLVFPPGSVAPKRRARGPSRGKARSRPAAQWLVPVVAGTALGVAVIVGAAIAGRAYLEELLAPDEVGESAPSPGSVPDLPAAAPDLREPVADAAPGSVLEPLPEAADVVPDQTSPEAEPIEVAAVAAPVPVVDPDAEKIAALLESTNQAIDAFRLTRPAGNSAVDFIEQVLQIDPSNAAVRAAFERIAGRYAVLARARLNEGNSAKARLYVDRGMQIDDANGDLQSLDRELVALARTEPETDPASRAVPAPDWDPGPTRTTIKGESPAELFGRIKRFFADD